MPKGMRGKTSWDSKPGSTGSRVKQIQGASPAVWDGPAKKGRAKVGKKRGR